MKKIFSIVAIILTLALMPIALFGCNVDDDATTNKTTGTSATTGTTNNNNNNNNNNNSQPKPEGEEEIDADTLVDKTYVLEDEKDLKLFKRLGRTVVADGGLCCDYVGSGIEFEGVFVGEVGIKVTVDSVEGQESRSRGSYFTVYVDGVRLEDTYDEEGNRTEGVLFAAYGTDEISFIYFKNPGRHTIRIVKQTGPRHALACIETVYMTGELSDAPADRELYIEVIGDSITSGQGTAGNLNATDIYAGTTICDYADGTKTYAYRTAEAFDADCSVISESAIAMDGSWFRNNRRTIFDHYNSCSYNREWADKETYAFDFENARVPDLVIINLGTNDDALRNNSSAPVATTAEKTKTAVKELITLIRSKYGNDVPIVWASGMLGRSSVTWTAIDTAIAELGGESAKIYTVTLPGDNVGQSSHPSAQAHENAANTLIAFIKDKKLLG